MRIIFCFISLVYFNSSFLYSQNDSSILRSEDKIRIAVAVNIFNEYGNMIWKNWDNAPFAILLVINDKEYLMKHPFPSDDFINLGYDTLIKSDILTRPRQFSNNFLATFPAVNGISTIVMGIPENTGRTGSEWILTILHEHFHQLQSSQPDYYSAVDSLDLAGDDKSGMWMLNYKFPYNDILISDQYKILTQSAKRTYLSVNDTEFEINMARYLNEREKFKSLLDKKDYDYFSFQIWQEGIARYTETEIAKKLMINYKPGNELSNLSDLDSMDSLYSNIINNLLIIADTQDLIENQRNCFYTFGALEGLILDRANPEWKDLYFKEKFYIEKYIAGRD